MSMDSLDPHFNSAALLTIDVQSDTLDGGALEIPGNLSSRAPDRQSVPAHFAAPACRLCTSCGSTWPTEATPSQCAKDLVTGTDPDAAPRHTRTAAWRQA